jgi:hypothetical protein
MCEAYKALCERTSEGYFVNLSFPKRKSIRDVFALDDELSEEEDLTLANSLQFKAC